LFPRLNARFAPIMQPYDEELGRKRSA